MSLALPAEEQNDCPIFKLPPELRNDIYELAFTPDDDEMNADGTICMDRATLPSKDIVVTCQRIYLESKGLYRKACQEYCESVFATGNGSDSRDSLMEFCEKDSKITDHARNFKARRKFVENRPVTTVGITFDTTWFISANSDGGWDARIVVHSNLPQLNRQTVAEYEERFSKMITFKRPPKGRPIRIWYCCSRGTSAQWTGCWAPSGLSSCLSLQ